MKLDKNGYIDWRKQMLRVLKSFKLDGFVSGAIECPRNENGTIYGAHHYWLY